MKQQLLIDQPPDMWLKGAGQIRTRVGNVVEELVCRIMEWKHKPKGYPDEIAPDAESKAVPPIVGDKPLMDDFSIPFYHKQTPYERSHPNQPFYAKFQRQTGRFRR